MTTAVLAPVQMTTVREGHLVPYTLNVVQPNGSGGRSCVLDEQCRITEGQKGKLVYPFISMLFPTRGNMFDHVTSSENTFDHLTSSDITLERVTSSENTIECVASSGNTFERVTLSENTFERMTSSENTFKRVTSPDNTFDHLTSSDIMFKRVTSSDNTFDHLTSSEETVHLVISTENIFNSVILKTTVSLMTQLQVRIIQKRGVKLQRPSSVYVTMTQRNLTRLQLLY